MCAVVAGWRAKAALGSNGQLFQEVQSSRKTLNQRRNERSKERKCQTFSGMSMRRWWITLCQRIFVPWGRAHPRDEASTRQRTATASAATSSRVAQMPYALQPRDPGSLNGSQGGVSRMPQRLTPSQFLTAARAVPGTTGPHHATFHERHRDPWNGVQSIYILLPFNFSRRSLLFLIYH